LDFNEKYVFQLVSADHVQIWSGVGFPFVRSLRFTALIFLLVSRFFCWIHFPRRFFLPFVLPLVEAFLLRWNFAAAQNFSLDLKVPALNFFFEPKVLGFVNWLALSSSRAFCFVAPATALAVSSLESRSRSSCLLAARRPERSPSAVHLASTPSSVVWSGLVFNRAQESPSER
jgi:hypothetical protein